MRVIFTLYNCVSTLYSNLVSLPHSNILRVISIAYEIAPMSHILVSAQKMVSICKWPVNFVCADPDKSVVVYVYVKDT